jgi:SAM-dependent methyltransferase
METLAQIYSRYNNPDWNKGSDKGNYHSYIEVYEELLAPYRTTALRVLEIGIMGGASLRMWEEYFAGAQVHGADCCDQPHGGLADLRPLIAEGTHHIHLLDATYAPQVEAAFAGMLFDVIIEDASHALEHQLIIYRNFKEHVAPGGIYIIEDIADIDRHRPLFERIDPSKQVRILDRRPLKDRFDDVLVVITE